MWLKNHWEKSPLMEQLQSHYLPYSQKCCPQRLKSFRKHREAFAFGLHVVIWNIPGHSLKKQCAWAWKISPENTGTRVKVEKGASQGMEVGQGSGNSHWPHLEGRDTLDLKEEECVFLQQLESSQPQPSCQAKQEPCEEDSTLSVPTLKWLGDPDLPQS